MKETSSFFFDFEEKKADFFSFSFSFSLSLSTSWLVYLLMKKGEG